MVNEDCYLAVHKRMIYFFSISTAIQNVAVLIDEQIDRETARKSTKIVINSMYTKNIKGEIEENANLHRSILFLKIDLIPISSEFKLRRNINQNLARLLQKFTLVSNTSPHSCILEYKRQVSNLPLYQKFRDSLNTQSQLY